jgi:hypothetical protein
VEFGGPDVLERSPIHSSTRRSLGRVEALGHDDDSDNGDGDAVVTIELEELGGKKD